MGSPAYMGHDDLTSSPTSLFEKEKLIFSLMVLSNNVEQNSVQSTFRN